MTTITKRKISSPTTPLTEIERLAIEDFIAWLRDVNRGNRAISKWNKFSMKLSEDYTSDEGLLRQYLDSKSRAER